MAEYIEREALIKAVRIMPRTIRPELVRYSTVQAIIDKQPAADVVEVVRCKDCIQWDDKEKDCCVFYNRREYDYCSYGERRLENENT